MNNDLISREALKKKFDEYIKANPNISGVFELGKFIIDTAPTVDIKDEIAGAYNEGYMCGNKEEKARLQGEWIPVSDKLPEEGKSVLVCLQTQGGMSQYVSERFNEKYWSALGGRTPLAWQPLPEPYKKGGAK